MAANTFNDDAVKRIKTTVKTVENSPLQGPSYRRRSKGRASKTKESEKVIFSGVVTGYSNGKYTISTSTGETVTGTPIQLNITSIIPNGKSVAVFSDNIEVL